MKRDHEVLLGMLYDAYSWGFAVGAIAGFIAAFVVYIG